MACFPLHRSLRGPFVMLRLQLGLLSYGKLGPVEIISEYINHGQLEEVRGLPGREVQVTGSQNLSYHLLLLSSYKCMD